MTDQDTKTDSTAHSTAWLGVNVVLLDDADPEAPKERMHERMHPSPPKDSAAVPVNNRRSFVRRKTSGEGEDYGWLREMDLRRDIPDMDEILSWDFDVLLFEEDVLVKVFLKLFDHYHLIEKFDIDRDTLERYTVAVKNRHYKDCFYHTVEFGQDEVKEEKIDADYQTLCEYHNWYHAVSCAHFSFLFLTLGGADEYLSADEIFAVIFGALIHDLDHPGTNNDFEVKMNSPLAEQYGNDAVLERHSINEGLKLCDDRPELNVLKSFGNEERRQYLDNFIEECILATDPARHAGVMKDAMDTIEEGQLYKNANDEPTYLDKSNPVHRVLIGRMILHCADISNPLHSSFEVARDWAIRVTTEFSRQAFKEKKLKLPVTPFMEGIDSEYKIAKLQIGFFGFMVQPLFQLMGKLLPKSNHLVDWGEDNCDGYRKLIKEYEEKHNIPTSS